ncbi:MAG: hypothetical protein BJ554DRAFT_6663, partial [Olpidium bornovanus]
RESIRDGFSRSALLGPPGEAPVICIGRSGSCLRRSRRRCCRCNSPDAPSEAPAPVGWSASSTWGSAPQPFLTLPVDQRQRQTTPESEAPKATTTSVMLDRRPEVNWDSFQGDLNVGRGTITTQGGGKKD